MPIISTICCSSRQYLGSFEGIFSPEQPCTQREGARRDESGSHKTETEREKMFIKSFYELDLSGSLKCLGCSDPDDRDIVVVILQLLIAPWSLTEEAGLLVSGPWSLFSLSTLNS